MGVVEQLFGQVVTEKSWMDPVIILEASLVCDTLGRMHTYATALYPLCISWTATFFFSF
jgi:hypothetical protein